MNLIISLTLFATAFSVGFAQRFPIPNIGNIQDAMFGKCNCVKEIKELSENVTKLSQQMSDMKLQLSNLSKKDDQKVENMDAIGKFLRGGILQATNPIKKEELQKFVAENEEQMKKEYESVPEGQYYKWDVGRKAENFPSKHRYDFSKAYDHSRVVLKVFADDKDSTDYINANYVDGYDLTRRFIATQAPIPTTVNDHWRMIFDTDAGVIVTLTKLVEKNATKSEKYWADSGEKMFGDISVNTIKTEKLPDLDIRHYWVKRYGETKDVVHFHFLGWPDTGTPTNPQKLLELIDRVRKSPNLKPLRPVAVHCSAGVGRTGTFMLLFNMIEMAEKNESIDIYKHFAKMRTQRVNAIETLDQYKFVYKTLLIALNNKM